MNGAGGMIFRYELTNPALDLPGPESLAPRQAPRQSPGSCDILDFDTGLVYIQGTVAQGNT